MPLESVATRRRFKVEYPRNRRSPCGCIPVLRMPFRAERRISDPRFRATRSANWRGRDAHPACGLKPELNGGCHTELEQGWSAERRAVHRIAPVPLRDHIGFKLEATLSDYFRRFDKIRAVSVDGFARARIKRRHINREKQYRNPE